MQRYCVIIVSGDDMDIYTVSLFGHRELSNSIEIEKQLYKLVRELICEKEYVEFLVGRNGDFDTLSSSVIRRAMRDSDYGNAAHTLVLPYQTAEFMNNTDSFKEYYSNIEVCEQSATAHYKAAIEIRNRAMIARSDLVICYVERKRGGANKAQRYAERQGRTVINLAVPNK